MSSDSPFGDFHPSLAARAPNNLRAQRARFGRSFFEAIELAFGRCPVEVNRADLFRRRFELQHKPADACDAVVHGLNSEWELARLCVEGGSPGWKVEVAKATLGQDAPARLRSAINASDVTSHALLEFVRTSGVSHEETCAAIARAERVELRWQQPPQSEASTS